MGFRLGFCLVVIVGFSVLDGVGTIWVCFLWVMICLSVYFVVISCFVVWFGFCCLGF